MMSACAGDSARKLDSAGIGIGLPGDRCGDVTAGLPQRGDLSVVVEAGGMPKTSSTV